MDGLFEFAKNEFELARPQPDGRPLREHLVASERRSRGRKKIKQLHVKCPDAMRSCWARYTDIRTSSAPRKPIGYADIQAYCALMRVSMPPEEVKLIKKIDAAYLDSTPAQMEDFDE